VTEFLSQQMRARIEVEMAPAEEKPALIQNAKNLPNEFADRFYEMAENNPNDPGTIDALFWVLQKAPQSAAADKVAGKIIVLIDEMPLKELMGRLDSARSSNQKLLQAVFRRAEKEEKNPLSGDMLGWVVMNGGPFPIGQEAIDRLLEKYPNHPAIERICLVLNEIDSPKVVDILKPVFEKSKDKRVRATAALGLGKNFANQCDELGDNLAEADKLAAEAEKYLTIVVNQYGDDNPALKVEADKGLKSLRKYRAGKIAPDIVANDLDGQEFKLSEYRGKVVLLDFWGHW
jgi:hypothetical protein